MGEEEFEGEPWEHEPEEVEDTDKVPDEIVIRKEEQIKGREIGTVKEVGKKKPIDAVREEIERLEDLFWPRKEEVEGKQVFIADQEVLLRVNEDIKRVDMALKNEAGKEAEELRERINALKKQAKL